MPDQGAQEGPGDTREAMPPADGLFNAIFGRGSLPEGVDAAWLRALLDAEAGLARAVERAGLAPPGAGAAVTEAARAARFDMGRLGELAALTGNPVPGLARELARQVEPSAARAVHRGATSQDIMDTAAMLLAGRVIDGVLADLARAAEAAAGLAQAHRTTIMIGRTLLQQAVPITFGLVAAGWLAGLDEARSGLAGVRATRLAVQFGGATGTLASLGEDGPRVVALFAEELGLAAPALPWHTDRLRIIDVGAGLARTAATLGKIARDVSLLSQSEVGELREGPAPRAPGAGQSPAGGPGVPGAGKPPAGGPVGGFRGEVPPAGGFRGEVPPAGGFRGEVPPAGGFRGEVPPDRGGVTGGVAPPGEIRRGGSSAMPHKRNPVAAVSVLACTRQVPGLLATLVASAEQEYQRAAGAWHAEWEPFTALLRLTGSASSWGAELLSGLTVDTQRMAANLAATEGLLLAEHVASLLAGVLGSAEEAHDLVAIAGERALSAGLPLRDVLLGVPELADRLAGVGVTPEQIEAALEPAGYLGAAGAFINAALAAYRSSGPGGRDG